MKNNSLTSSRNDVSITAVVAGQAQNDTLLVFLVLGI